MPAAMKPLANITLGSAASTVTFSSINGTYRDLVLIATFTNGVSSNDYIAMKLNNDTGSNYNSVTMRGNGSGTASASYASSTYGWLTVDGGFQTSRGNLRLDLMDYATTDKHKTYIVRNGTYDKGVEAIAGRWASTSAVTSINLYSVNGWTFAAGSTFALYGVSA